MIQFDHIYLEQSAANLPYAQALIERLQPRTVTTIEDAQRFFKRPAQDFARQKAAPRLILARKHGSFLYRGSERVASFGVEQDVYYTDMLRNCLYDCDYCFLQGMHRSANILLNANEDDYVAAVKRHISDHGALYLSISYLSDVLGFERHFGLGRRWIAIAANTPGLEIEVRTKSDGFSAVHDLTPTKRVVFTWSLSPEAVARDHEDGTAGFQQRLFDARRAMSAGWRVRLCFDPIVVDERWRERYRHAVESTFQRLEGLAVEAVSFGVIRMHPDFLTRIGGFRRPSSLEDGIVADARVASYTEEVRQEVFASMSEWISMHVPADRVWAVHG